jgi:hypothetical protein
MMRRRASFDPDEARRQSGEELQQLQTTDTLADHHRA